MAPKYLAAAGLLASVALATTDCDTINGYTCETSISRLWGEYSPYYALTTVIPSEVPIGCEVVQASILNRHGARYPTTKKGADYSALIATIQASTTSYSAEYAFIKDLTYNLSTNNLTPFGEQELIFSGEKFYERYESLAKNNVPFVRADSATRTIQSAHNFTQGFLAACDADPLCKVSAEINPADITILTASSTMNDTLDPDNCYEYENGYESDTNSDAEADWEAVFIPAIQAEVNENLVGANLTITETVYFMDLCPFFTVDNIDGTPSAFCNLFNASQWADYNYLRTIDKFYADGPGNYLGPSQGVGYVNELVARMTLNRSRALADETTVNHTLDASNTTFPIGNALYADFSHDDPMYSIFTAMGLFNNSASYPADISNTTFESDAQYPFTSARTVPFAGRAYIEKLSCVDGISIDGLTSGDWVRVILNDEVLTLQNCDANILGMCTLDKWVDSLTFAADNGYWSACPKPKKS